MTTDPAVNLARGTDADARPYVQCFHTGCDGQLRLPTDFPWTPDALYASLKAAGWSTDPSKCPTHRADVYDQLTENDRRAIVDWVIGQGRHLAGLEEWEMEDNFATTEGTAEVYSSLVLPHEAPDTVCTCGHSGHPGPIECDREPSCQADSHEEDCAVLVEFDEGQVYVDGSGDYCVHTEHGWQVVESGEMVVLFSPRNGSGGFDSQVIYQTPGHNAPWRAARPRNAQLARLVVEEFNEAHQKAWARRARKAQS